MTALAKIAGCRVVLRLSLYVVLVREATFYLYRSQSEKLNSKSNEISIIIIYTLLTIKHSLCDIYFFFTKWKKLEIYLKTRQIIQ